MFIKYEKIGQCFVQDNKSELTCNKDLDGKRSPIVLLGKGSANLE